MNTMSISYNLKWQFKSLPYYKVSECKKVFNTRTGRKLKHTVNGGSRGFWIKSIFVPVSKLNELIEIIPKKEKIPF